MRCRALLLAFAIPLAVLAAALGASARSRQTPVSSTTFVLIGHGYGHGVGMGQWGAYGMAETGAAYDKILGFYYPGTQLGQTPVKSVRVLLAETSSAVTVSSASPFTLRDSTGQTRTVSTGQLTVDPGPVFHANVGTAGASVALTGPLTVKPGKSPLVFHRPYRGSIQLQTVGPHLQVVNVLSLDNYVRGVVTEEMPQDWPLAALEAQAVAARSYAIATLGVGKVVYTDQRSQVYGGLQGETTPGGQAVVKTRGQVLLFGDKVATTFFSSSSGGRTTAITDLVPGAKPVPYLIDQKDPYDSASPWHNWGPVVLTGAQMSKALGVTGITDLTTVPVNDHVRQLVATTASGTQKTLSSAVLRGNLGLRSTFVKIGVLQLTRPAAAAAPGSPVTLTGKARFVKGPVTLEQATGGGAWSPGTALTPAADGTFSVTVAPQQTTLYRLSTPGVKGQPLSVPVSSARRLQVVQGPRRPRHPFTSSFVPSDPLSGQQWYLAHDHAFDYWPDQPSLSPVLVGIVDTGIDLNHPEFAGKIAYQKSFVGGTIDDKIGHGTFVAGEIAAALGNGQGIAGIAFPAKLMIAKVVGSDQTIDPEVEAKAIRWEVDKGARVINLSLGAVRDPVDPSIDAYSSVEAAAVQYAVAHGVLVVAAAGNGDDSPTTPWPYASYPAALPHVLGVGALAQDGAVPLFSNRDATYVDIAAPGVGILSTFPRSLTAQSPTCYDQGYSDCGTSDYRTGDGTSFAAPQVTAAAALLLAVRPGLSPDQVSWILERTADDVTPATGCPSCTVGRDALSGWGSLDIESAVGAALNEPLPPRDHDEPNDDAGVQAARLWGSTTVVHATVSYWDDPVDVYSIRVAPGQSITATVRGPAAVKLKLTLWKPGTRHVTGTSASLRTQRAVESLHSGPQQAVRYHATAGGWYDVEVQPTARHAGAYTLRVTKTS
jgi:stage II sporulation protein D